ncbi:MAG: tRNA lysidine(34) synthetase TilS, partial [Planctomycetes bacterium]|nr:tRNA lysidine(34) synthetase TilS [Planctomycetota bacterium]
MLSAFFSAALQRILARAGNPKNIIAALSGGRDSVVLLHLLVNSRERFPSGTRLVAAHLNHALRGEDAELDQEFCRGLAASHKVEFALRRADAAKTARDERLNIEEAGRILRQRFFLDLAEVGGGAVVLTGHHADDQAETVLLHLRRGAHRRGLAGMREFVEIPVAPGRKIGIGRPLLAVGREELCAYAVRRRLVWREDATNSDVSFYRNRIRQRILPML